MTEWFIEFVITFIFIDAIFKIVKGLYEIGQFIAALVIGKRTRNMNWETFVNAQKAAQANR